MAVKKKQISQQNLVNSSESLSKFTDVNLQFFSLTLRGQRKLLQLINCIFYRKVILLNTCPVSNQLDNFSSLNASQWYYNYKVVVSTVATASSLATVKGL